MKAAIMPSASTTYKVVTRGGELFHENHQHGEVFEDREQAEKVAELLNARDKHNHPRQSRNWAWTVEESATVPAESTYFVVYSVSIKTYIYEQEDGSVRTVYVRSDPNAELAKDSIPEETVQRVDSNGHSAWNVTVYNTTIDGAKERSLQMRRWMELGDPTEHLNQR
jgi:hypothetical protein